MTTNNQHPPSLHHVSPKVLIVFVAAILASPAQAQTSRPIPAAKTKPAPRQAFEAASIRIVDPHSTIDHNNPSDPSNHPQTFPSNRRTMSYVQMISLICEAYVEIECGNVLGGPPWLRANQTHYDITAKVEGNAMLTQDQMRPMLRTLLEERFHLAVHTERRIVSGYALVIAKGGPRLQPNKGTPYGGLSAVSEFKFQNVSADYLAKLIGWQAKQPVVDKTGIQGMFDVDLKFRPPTGPYIDDPRFANLPDIFTAVQEQFGLKLLRQKVPVDYLIVDHVDRIPTDN